ncbi:salicylate hydroxylase [Pseudorhizobium tarimense]|uniref:Salicylate hydroxylase n=1 Tax=Pseudorhizobium tarimense TaxID=1079109 RepID=A0ABV2H3Z8_9HYPH|nr:FAD-dependent monooxygenase [Pseudorhizobium tarimense]MCJ8518322.1 FAD-dependent monooxygenase [Pseudorhizobium tarimense]
MPTEIVTIIGAGIAGLAAALSFARKGIACEVVEQAPALTEVGAGLQISPNASRILGTLGVLEKVERVWCEPDHISLVSGTNLRPIAQVPAGGFARTRWGAPYGVLHRATLQAALLETVQAQPLCTLTLGSQLSAGDVAERCSQENHLLVGADGVWSETRHRIANGPEPSFSGNVAWRFTIATEEAPSFLSRNAVCAFLGPSAHLVCYPLNDLGGFNIVAIASGISPGETWEAKSSEVQRRMLLSQFRAWDKRILDLLADAPAPTFWPLYQMIPGRWHNGRDTVLIGDAAHAMMPFAAQGAAMAIEDAFALASHAGSALMLPQALSAFEGERVPRITRVRSRGMFNRFAYHARGPTRLGRDIVLSLRPPQSLAADFDWLYGYRSGA